MGGREAQNGRGKEEGPEGRGKGRERRGGKGKWCERKIGERSDRQKIEERKKGKNK